MASDENFVQFITDQMGTAGTVSCKKMFGEYAIYCDGKVVALVCNNQLFVKPTEGGRSFIGDVVEAAPYPGARSYFLVLDEVENREWLGDLIRTTARELPIPGQKQGKSRIKKIN